MTLVDHLSGYSAAAWAAAVETISPDVHPVDRNATRVWFAFFPLELHLALEAAGGPAATSARECELELTGTWRLAAQVDASHTFLYGHRYWPQVRRAILAAAGEASWPAALPELIVQVADRASRTSMVDRDQLLGMSAVALMTLRQAGMDAFAASSGTVQLSHRAHVRSIRQVRRARARPAWRPFGFLLNAPRFRMTFSEALPDGWFDLTYGQDIASAATWNRERCGDASCGACWIGVLHGAEHLSPIDPAVEGRRLTMFGDGDARGTDGAPLIRLACQARPSGDVSFVVPPWSGIAGKIRKKP